MEKLKRRRGDSRLTWYMLAGFLGGSGLFLLEAVERTIVLWPFLHSFSDRLIFSAYFAVSIFVGLILGLMMAGVVALLRWVEGKVPLPLKLLAAGSPSPMAWMRRLAAAVPVLILTIVAASMDHDWFLLRRAIAHFIVGPLRWPGDSAQTIYVLAITIGGTAALLLLIEMLYSIDGHLMSSDPSGRVALPLVAVLAVGTPLAYLGDSRLGFGFYDENVHLLLFFLQAGGAVALSLVVCVKIRRHYKARVWPRVLVPGLAVAVMLTGISFRTFDERQDLKALFCYRSVAAKRVYKLAQWLVDSDGDGFSPVLGGGDCNDANAAIHPMAHEVLDNQVDENCLGGDLTASDLKLRAVSAAAAAAPPLTSGPRPNVVLITLDACRADHLGCYGYARPTSPNLDRFAGKGCVFTRAFSPGSNTGVGFASMAHSLQGEAMFSKTIPTLAETLAQSGYATSFFTTLRVDRWLYKPAWLPYKAVMLRGFQFVAHTAGEREWPAERLTDEAISFLQSGHSSQPSFIWVHYLETHAPYVAHAGFDFGEDAMSLYDGEIAYADAHIGRLLDFLESSGALDNTLVIIAADHGEGFRDHGEIHHTGKVYQEMLHVPLIIGGPRVPAARLNTPVSLIDLAPTILSFAHVAVPRVYEGIDLMPLMEGNSPPKRPLFAEPFFGEAQSTQRDFTSFAWAIIDWPWKLIYDIRNDTFELYNLEEDSGERRDLIDQRPMRAEALKRQLDIWLYTHGREHY